MKKTLLTLVLTTLASCSSVKPAPDEFTIIAEEWQGANINEMIGQSELRKLRITINP